MTEITVANPHKMETKTVDGSGRVYVGKDLTDEDVEIIVVRKDASGAENSASTPQEDTDA